MMKIIFADPREIDQGDDHATVQAISHFQDRHDGKGALGRVADSVVALSPALRVNVYSGAKQPGGRIEG